MTNRAFIYVQHRDLADTQRHPWKLILPARGGRILWFTRDDRPEGQVRLCMPAAELLEGDDLRRRARINDEAFAAALDAAEGCTLGHVGPLSLLRVQVEHFTGGRWQ